MPIQLPYIPDVSGPTISKDGQLRNLLIAIKNTLTKLTGVDPDSNRALINLLNAEGKVSGLTDVEMGTWVPLVNDALTGGNPASPAIAIGKYYKVGHLVTAFCYITDIDTTGMTGANVLYIDGLPYPGARTIADFDQLGVCITDTVDLDGTNSFLTCRLANTYTAFSIRESDDAAVDGSVTVGDLTSGTSDLWCQLTYITEPVVKKSQLT